MFMEPRPSTLPEILDLSARLYPRRLALAMRQGLRDDRWTYARLHKTSCDWASFLQSRGLRAGDRLLLQSSSSPSLIAAMFGAFRAGVVLVPLDAQCTASFIAQVAVDTHARGLLGPPHAQPPPGLPLIPLGPVADSHRGIAPPVRPDDLAEIMFTSGTTAQPKGVMLTHGNIVSNVWSASVLPHGPDHRLLSVLPISHMLEQTGGIFLPLSSGASIAFTTSMRSSALLFAFAERRPTTLVAVPRLLDLLLQGIVRDIETRGRLSHWRAAHQLAPQLPMVLRRIMFYPVHRALGGSLRWIFSGGAALDPELQAAWRQLGITLMQGYGATECAPLVSCQRAIDTSIGSVGRALPGITVKLRDDSELMVRGPNVTSGYWQNAQATSEVVHDGWYATGDFARIDDNGEIRLLGRKREMITLPSGLKVFPADIDAELQREATLADAATVSWSSDGSAAVYAVVIPRPDVDPSQVGRAIRSANARLAAHQQITGWSIWPERQLPLTPARKVRRGEIVAWLQRPDQTKPDTLDETDSRSPSLLRLLALTTHRQLADILPTTMLTSDLGLDSLARVELAVAIEQQFGVAVSDEAMGQADTVADLEQLIASSPGEVTAKEFPSWPFSALATRARTALQRTLIIPLLRLICRPLVIVGGETSAKCEAQY